MDRRYFVSDLDGTLLGNKPGLSSLTTHTIARAQSDGHVFSFSTARSLTSALKVAGKIEWNCPVTVYNGAVIMDVAGRTGTRIIDKRLLDPDMTKDLIGVGEKYGLSPFMYMTSRHGDEIVYYQNGSEGHPYWVVRQNPRFQAVDVLTIPEELDVVVLNFMGEQSKLIPLYEELEETAPDMISPILFSDTYIDDFFFLEVRHLEANKGDALKRWAEVVGCKVDEITVFGDQLNDIELFEAAGTSVAVDNAVDELKEKATEKTWSNTEDGVARYLMKELGYVGSK